VTLPDPYRGHAQPTWDTKTLAALISAMGGVGASAPPSLTVADGRYARSPLAYFVDVENGDGIGTITTANNATWTKINAAGTVWANNGGGWDSSSDLYTVPAGGTYYCQALVRLADGISTSFNMALGIGPSLADAAYVQWNKYFTGAGGRCAFDYTRIAGFSQSQQIQLYCFQDSGAPQNITRASLQFWRLC